MAMATVLSRAQHGMDAPLVRVEVDVGTGFAGVRHRRACPKPS